MQAWGSCPEGEAGKCIPGIGKGLPLVFHSFCPSDPILQMGS